MYIPILRELAHLAMFEGEQSYSLLPLLGTEK
jgi:hypothetical protein